MRNTETIRGNPDVPRRPRNPNHHIWCNHGTWFVHVTLKWSGRRRRVRKSLKTKDVNEARLRRDRFLDLMQDAPNLTLLLR